MTQDKKLNNRFDQYQIASIFTEYAEDFLPKKWNILRNNFYIKCVLGVLLFLNGYFSHWGPWPWPTNYNFLIFSIIFYHVGTYIYGLQSPVKNQEGNTIGFYKVGARKVVAVLRIGKDKQKYTVEIMEGKESLAATEIAYYEYFTEKGVFLSSKFRKVLQNVVNTVDKASR